MYEVKQEKTGWRDLAFSLRHKKWGWNCPAIDIDFLMIEFDEGIPEALVEYKRETAEAVKPDSKGIMALSVLGTRARIPVFIVRYTKDFGEYLVAAVNNIAREILPVRTTMSEEGWVSFLYRLRRREMPLEVLRFIREEQIKRIDLNLREDYGAETAGDG